ncbi:DNA polymerase III subunit chi [soil metagenome]
MSEVMFYHLERQPLDRVLPQLVERSLARGWKAVIQVESEERVEAISTLLWTYSDDSFLPHGSARDGSPALQPVWLTTAEENPNGAQVRFLAGGARVSRYDDVLRTAYFIDGGDAEAIEQARGLWKEARAGGHAVSYWQQDGEGHWTNRAASGEE